MSDQELRVLERAAAKDAAQTLAYVRALERAGRGDDAWLLLCSAIGQPAVRDELHSRAPWDRTRSLDVPAVLGQPRVRWSSPVKQRPGAWLVSPIALVTMIPGRPHQIRDPRDGSIRFLVRPLQGPRWLNGGRLLGTTGDNEDREQLLAWEPWPDGSTHPRKVFMPRSIELPAHEGAWMTTLPAGRIDEIDASALAKGSRTIAIPPDILSGARPPDLPECGTCLVHSPRSARTHGVRWYEAELRTSCSRARIVVSRISGHRRSTTVAFDRDTLRLGWRRDEALAAHDEEGTVLHDSGDQTTLVDDAGVTVWSRGGFHAEIMGREVLVGRRLEEFAPRSFGARDVLVIERATGRIRTSLGADREYGASARVLLVRDVVVVGSGRTMTAWSLDGRRVWTFDLAENGLPSAQIVDLAPLPGALVIAYAEGQAGGFLCVEGAVS
jgi:hypothetical protein